MSEVLGSDGRLGMLLALRDRLASEVDECDDQRLLPALVLRLTDVLEQIDSMPVSRVVSSADEIAKRRAARRGGGAKDSARPPRSG
jgi:hypothetical protein